MYSSTSAPSRRRASNLSRKGTGSSSRSRRVPRDLRRQTWSRPANPRRSRGDNPERGKTPAGNPAGVFFFGATWLKECPRNHPNAPEDNTQPRGPAYPVACRNDLLEQDVRGDGRHPEHAHHPRHEQHRHQKPTQKMPCRIPMRKTPAPTSSIPPRNGLLLTIMGERRAAR
jgi:hypothetical protein